MDVSSVFLLDLISVGLQVFPESLRPFGPLTLPAASSSLQLFLAQFREEIVIAQFQMRNICLEPLSV